MSDIFVEQRGEKYVAIQNKRVIAEGKTQQKAGENAHRKKPDDPILAERVRNTKGGSRDQWRRLYP